MEKDTRAVIVFSFSQFKFVLLKRTFFFLQRQKKNLTKSDFLLLGFSQIRIFQLFSSIKKLLYTVTGFPNSSVIKVFKNVSGAEGKKIHFDPFFPAPAAFPDSHHIIRTNHCQIYAHIYIQTHIHLFICMLEI